MLIQRKINGTTYAFQLTPAELHVAAEEFKLVAQPPQSEMDVRLKAAERESESRTDTKGEKPHEPIRR